MAIIGHRLEEKGDALQVLNKHQVHVGELVVFRFILRGGEGEHKLTVHGKGTGKWPTFLKSLDGPDPSVIVRPGDSVPAGILAIVRGVSLGDYEYEIVEWDGVKWVTVLDPILEIEGGGLSPKMPTVVAAVAVGLLAGFLAHKALK